MLKGLYTAYSGMLNEQNRMDVITNNLANATTNGYKKEGATSQAFNDVLAYKLKDLSDAPGTAKYLGVNNPGVKIGECYTDYSQGSLKATDNAFDLALSGSGFFVVSYTNKAGEASYKYTRDGSFTVDAEGYLRTHDGDFVVAEDGGNIQLDPNLNAVIDSQGNIRQGTNNQVVAQIRVRDFDNYDYLEKFGENYYQPVAGATNKDPEFKIYQGYLEMANVSVVNEMVSMISISRAYETNQKAIQTYDSSLEIAVNQLGKL